MELHGGRGAQLIYRIVCLIDAAAGWVILLLRGSSGASRVTEAEHDGPVMKDRGKKKPCRLASATTPLKKHP